MSFWAFIFIKIIVDGVWSQWGDWGDCSTSCGNGTTTRRRTCVGPFNGGMECPAFGQQDQDWKDCQDNPIPRKLSKKGTTYLSDFLLHISESPCPWSLCWKHGMHEHHMHIYNRSTTENVQFHFRFLFDLPECCPRLEFRTTSEEPGHLQKGLFGFYDMIDAGGRYDLSCNPVFQLEDAGQFQYLYYLSSSSVWVASSFLGSDRAGVIIPQDRDCPTGNLIQNPLKYAI